MIYRQHRVKAHIKTSSEMISAVYRGSAGATSTLRKLDRAIRRGAIIAPFEITKAMRKRYHHPRHKRGEVQ